MRSSCNCCRRGIIIRGICYKFALFRMRRSCKVFAHTSHYFCISRQVAGTQGVYVSLKFRRGRTQGNLWLFFWVEYGLRAKAGNSIQEFRYLSDLSWVMSRSSQRSWAVCVRTLCVMCLHEISGPPSTKPPPSRHLNHLFISLCFLFSLTRHPFRIVGKLWRVFYSLSPKAAPTFWITLFPASLTLCAPAALSRDLLGPGPPPVVRSVSVPRIGAKAFASIDQQQFVVQFAANLASHAGQARSVSGSGRSNMKNQTKDAAACVLRVFCLPAVWVCPSHSLPQHVSATVSPFLCLSVARSLCLWQECPGNSADRQQGQCVLIIVVIISWACSEREANVNIIKIKAVKWTNWVGPWVGWSDGCCFPTFFLIASFIYFLYVYVCLVYMYAVCVCVCVWVLLFVCKSVQWPVTKWERVDGRHTSNGKRQLTIIFLPFSLQWPTRRIRNEYLEI